MDYSKLTKKIIPKVMEAIALINNPEVTPAVRQLNQEILLREVGAKVYEKIYSMNAFDMEVPHTVGAGIDDRYYGLAKVASSSVSNGKTGVDEYVANYLLNTTGKAQKDAMNTARQSGKKTTVTRTESGDACKWCRSKTGTFENPSSEIFERHGGCSGKIVTKGYMSRNGLLSNYSNGKTAGSPSLESPIAPDGGQVVYRGTGKNVSSAGLELGSGFYVARSKETAQTFGNVNKLSLPLKSKDIYQIKTDAQYERLILDAQKWAVKNNKSLDSNDFIPAYVRNLGFKAAEVAPTVDPLGGIAIYDPRTIKKMQAQMK